MSEKLRECQKEFIGKDCRRQECIENNASEEEYLSDQMEDR